MIEKISNTKLIGGISINRFIWVDLIYKEEKIRVRISQKRDIGKNGDERFHYGYWKTDTNYYDEISGEDKLLGEEIKKYLEDDLNIRDYFVDELNNKIDVVFDTFSNTIGNGKK
jgi:hypothetical protein